MKKAKRNYSESFKEKAVSLSYQRENIKELADELGIQVQRIYKWRAGGYVVSKPRVAKLMRFNGLRSKVKKKYRVTTNSNHMYSISENHLNNFSIRLFC